MVYGNDETKAEAEYSPLRKERSGDRVIGRSEGPMTAIMGDDGDLGDPLYTPMTLMSSVTASALFFRAACSSGVSLISMICSRPLAPSLQGTPTNRSLMPYSPCK